MKKLCLAIVLTFLLLPLASIQAHGLGTSKSNLVGNYVVNFEYDELGNIPSGGLVFYVLELLDSTTETAVPFDKVYVKFSKKDLGVSGIVLVADLLESEVLAEGVRGARLNTTLYDPGQYVADISFFKDKNELARTSFDFTVDSNLNTTGKQDDATELYLWALLLVGGLVVGYGLRGKTRNVQSTHDKL